MEEYKCPICGEPTNKYYGNYRKDRLCFTHGQQAKAGEIEQCPDCGKWHKTGEVCECKAKYSELPTEGFNNCILCGEPSNGYAYCKDCWREYDDDELLDILNNPELLEKEKENLFQNDEEDEDIDTLESETNNYVKTEYEEKINNVIQIDEFNKSKCITCGRKTEGLLFCPSCYHKYKNKELLFKVNKCTEIELLDENYEGRYTCKDGHIVKSKSERDIDNYLFEHNIQHAYEKEIYYGAKATEVLHPDFFLKNYLGKDKHVYIEHWGYNENNISYTNTKKFKMPIYKELCQKKKMTLINTYEKTDSGKIEDVLDRKLDIDNIKENEINYDE